MFELCQSCCCYLCLQSHPNLARAADCTQSDSRLEEKKLKTKYLHCTRRKGTAKCSLLGSALCFCTQGYQCCPSPHLHTWKTRQVPTCPSLPAELQQAGRQGPSQAIHLLGKGTLEKAGSFILLAGGQELPLWVGRKHQGAMRKWAPKCLPGGLPRLGLL